MFFLRLFQLLPKQVSAFKVRAVALNPCVLSVLAQFLVSCLSPARDARNLVKISPLEDSLHRIGGTPVLSMSDLQRAIHHMHQQLFCFPSTVSSSGKNTSQKCKNISQKYKNLKVESHVSQMDHELSQKDKEKGACGSFPNNLYL